MGEYVVLSGELENGSKVSLIGELYLSMPDLLSFEARLPYCLAFSRFASLIYSAIDIGPLRFDELVLLRPMVPFRVALVLLYLLSYIADTIGYSRGEVEVLSFSLLAATAPPLYFIRFIFLISSSFYF